MVEILGKRSKGEQAKIDTTALLIGKWFQMFHDDPTKLYDSMEVIMQHPERIGGVALTLLNTTATLAQAYHPGGLQGMIDHFANQIIKD